MTQITASSDAPTKRTTRLLACGIAAGPLFLLVSLGQAGARDGFDLSRQPLSLLSLADLGWIQISNFIVTGVLCGACGIGMRRVLHPGRSGTWGPLLVGGLGLGLIVAGVFVTDPSFGYPPGAPTGEPEQFSWHGMLHALGLALAMGGMGVGCVVFIRRFAALKHWGWVVGCVATALTVLGLAAWPGTDGLSVRLVIASAILFGFVAALAGRLMRGLPD